MAGALLAVTVAGGTAEAGRSGERRSSPVRPRQARPVGTVPEISPELGGVRISSPEHAAAVRHRDDTVRSLREAKRTRTEATAALVGLRDRDAALTTRIDRARQQAERATIRIRHLRADLRELAVANYISGTEEGPGLSFDLDVRRQNELGSELVLMRTVHSTKLADLRRTRAVLEAARTEADLTTAVRAGVRRTIDTTEARRATATRDEAALGPELYAAEQRVADARRLAVVDGTDLPLVVLDAYVRAVHGPGAACGLPWWALAGIGLVESRHGTFGGARVRADGSLTRPIVGVPLTGAAAYLCASGANRSDQGLRAGYFSYNHLAAYVEVVLAEAHRYAGSVSIP